MSQIADEAGVAEAVERLAASIMARSAPEPLALIGVRRRGVPLAVRLAAAIEAQTGTAPQTGALDITLYRDDLSLVARNPVVRRTEIDFGVDGLRVVLVDDVLFTGRTVRSAIEALFRMGRPARVELAVLVDRGHRELPIAADHVGVTVETERAQRVEVRLREVDAIDEVVV